MKIGLDNRWMYIREEKTQVKDNWRTWIVWRLAKTDIDKEKYLKIINYIE